MTSDTMSGTVTSDTMSGTVTSGSMTGTVLSGAITGAARTTVVTVAAHQVALTRGGAGTHVLYLHGLCDMHSALPGDRFTDFLSRLVPTMDIVAPALPGYSGSSGVENMHDVEDYVFLLVDLLDRLVLRSVDVVGHSLGGWLAAELALRRPDRVRKMALVSPLGLHVPGLEVPPVFGALAPRGVGGFSEARRFFFADPDGVAALEALPDGMSEEQQLRWFGGLAGAARLGWKAPHFQSRRLTERLSRIAVPTLVVGAEQDLVVPGPMTRAWVDGMADARLVEVPKTGHAAVLETPVVAAEVIAFLDGL